MKENVDVFRHHHLGSNIPTSLNNNNPQIIRKSSLSSAIMASAKPPPVRKSSANSVTSIYYDTTPIHHISLCHKSCHSSRCDILAKETEAETPISEMSVLGRHAFIVSAVTASSRGRTCSIASSNRGRRNSSTRGTATKQLPFNHYHTIHGYHNLTNLDSGTNSIDSVTCEPDDEDSFSSASSSFLNTDHSIIASCEESFLRIKNAIKLSSPEAPGDVVEMMRDEIDVKSRQAYDLDNYVTPDDCISPELCKKFLAYSEDMNLLVRNITKEAKRLVHAEICSLFLLDKEHDELVAEVFEKNGTKDEFLTEIRMPLSQGIVGYVATTGKMLNVNDVYNNPYFYSKVDERTGFVTRNILCFPIKDSSENLVGVAELCNKVGDIGFTKNDERIASTFSVYCAISISHCLLYRKLQEAHRRSHMAAELLVQGSTLSIAPEDILRLTVRDIPSPSSFHADFNNFTFVPRSIGSGDIYVEASLSMFKDLGFIDKYRLRRRTLARFLLMVQKGYRDVPYHNWSHSYATGHFCYLLLRLPMVQNYLNDLERLSLLVACLCHDIDHRGTTNAFQLQSKTPLAQLYSSEGSVLERHHFAQTVTILGMDECNIFEQLTRQQYQQVLDNIREIILATDIAAHLRKVTKIKEMVHCGFNPDIPEHHYLFMCLLMTASDLSDQSKDFKTTKSIAENIYKEFFSQGDLEKQMGNAPMTMMDREKACVPKIQLEFMDTVALPVFKYLSDILPDLDRTYDTLQKNRVCWSTMQTLLDEEGSDPGSLEFLRDTELESRVYTKITDKKTNK